MVEGDLQPLSEEAVSGVREVRDNPTHPFLFMCLCAAAIEVIDGGQPLISDDLLSAYCSFSDCAC